MRNRKRIWCLLALVLVFVCSFGCGEGLRYEGEGFDTPEAAVACYMLGLKNLDFEQMLSAFAWETQAEHYSVETQLSWVKSYNPGAYPRMPAVNEFVKTANLEGIRIKEIRTIYNGLEKYIMGEDYPDGLAVPLTEEGAVEEFVASFDNGRLEKLAGMAEIQFFSPDMVTGGKFSLEMNKETFRKMTAAYGADEVVNVVAAAALEQGLVICMPTVARYGEKWYMVSLSSMMANILGIPTNSLALNYVEDLSELGL